MNDALLAEGWSLSDEVKATKKLTGHVGKKQFVVAKETVGTVIGMSSGKLVVKFPEGVISAEGTKWVVQVNPPAHGEESEKKNKLSVPKGFEFLRAPGGSELQVLTNWPSKLPRGVKESKVADLLDNIKYAAKLLSDTCELNEDDLSVCARDSVPEARYRK